MTNRKPPISDILYAWTDAERDVWDTWSRVEQDVSQPETMQGCGHVLDALETSTRQVVTLQSAVVRGMCGALSANPLLPDEGRVWVERVCEPLLGVSTWQQHFVAAWFGMARQMAATASGAGRLVK